MTLCQLIKRVLDEQYDEIPASGRDETIKQQLELLSQRYQHLKGTNCPGVNYGSPATRFAYIFKYTVPHADYIRQVIQNSEDIRAVFEQGHVEAACLGGGPGTDFLGMIKYMLRQGTKASLSCQIFDRERAWNDSWIDVARLLERDFNFYPSFAQMDAAIPADYQSYNRFRRADLFTLSYFMSELWNCRHQVDPFFQKCFSGAKAGALFIYIDNRNGDFRGWFDYLAGQHGISILHQWSGEMVFEKAEEKTDLGVYFDKFGWPKRKGSVDVRVGRKA